MKTPPTGQRWLLLSCFFMTLEPAPRGKLVRVREVRVMCLYGYGLRGTPVVGLSMVKGHQLFNYLLNYPIHRLRSMISAMTAIWPPSFVSITPSNSHSVSELARPRFNDEVVRFLCGNVDKTSRSVSFAERNITVASGVDATVTLPGVEGAEYGIFRFVA